MFKRLQKKWKVGPLQIILIIICFAIGGSATGFAAKKIMNLLSIEQDWLWAIIYILLITIIWPLTVVVVSIFFGQFKFFSGYVRRLGERLSIIKSSEFIVQSKESGVRSSELIAIGSGARSQKSTINLQSSEPLTLNSQLTTRIAIFASGTGSNTQKIIEHFRGSSKAKIALIVSNKSRAGVLRIAEENDIPTLILEKEKFFRGNGYIVELKEKKIDFIVLADFFGRFPRFC